MFSFFRAFILWEQYLFQGPPEALILENISVGLQESSYVFHYVVRSCHLYCNICCCFLTPMFHSHNYFSVDVGGGGYGFLPKNVTIVYQFLLIDSEND